MQTDFTKRSTYFYDLPQELIAQTPVEPRTASRLLHLDRSSGAVSHHHFYDLGQFLREGDLLVMLMKGEPQFVLEHQCGDYAGLIWKKVCDLLKDKKELAQKLKSHEEKQ